MIGQAFRSKYQPCSEEQKKNMLSDNISLATICDEGTYEVQKDLVEQHLKVLAEPLEAQNLTLDIYLSLYSQEGCPENFISDLVTWYGPNVKKVRHSQDDKHLNYQWRNRLNTLKMLRDESDGGYEYVMVGRYDYKFTDDRLRPQKIVSSVNTDGWTEAAKLGHTAFTYSDDQRVGFPWGFLNCMIAAFEDCERSGPATSENRSCRAGPFEFENQEYGPGEGMGLYDGLLKQMPPKIDGIDMLRDCNAGDGFNDDAFISCGGNPPTEEGQCACQLRPYFRGDLR
jgi:hypothetical protein